MKVLTKVVDIDNQEFVLIADTHDGRKYYGTIPYSELDESGRMKRALNGAQMCISFNSPAEAIDNRKRDIVMKRIVERFEAQGLDRMSAVMAMVETEEYKALYA